MQLANLTQDMRELPITKRRDTMHSFPIRHSSQRFINTAHTSKGFHPIDCTLNMCKEFNPYINTYAKIRKTVRHEPVIARLAAEVPHY